MNFAIDIIWIQQGKIVHIEQNILPPPKNLADPFLKRYGMGVDADMVLEVPAGYCKRKTIQLNDIVKIFP